MIAENCRSRTLYSEVPSPLMSVDWRLAYMTMKRLDADPHAFDLLLNVLVIGDKKVGKSKLVHTLAMSGKPRTVSASSPTSPTAGAAAASVPTAANHSRHDPVIDAGMHAPHLFCFVCVIRFFLNSTALFGVSSFSVWHLSFGHRFRRPSCGCGQHNCEAASLGRQCSRRRCWQRSCSLSQCTRCRNCI